MDAYRFSISWSRILPEGHGRGNQFPVYPAQFEPTAKDMESVEMADMFISRFYLDGVFKGKYPELTHYALGVHGYPDGALTWLIIITSSARFARAAVGSEN